MNRRKLLLAVALLAAYGVGTVAFHFVFPDLSDDALGAHVDVFFAFFTAVFVAVIALTSNWRFVGLVGRDRVPAVRWIVVIFIVLLVLQLLYLGAALLGYAGGQGATVIILINLAFVAFNEEVLFRGFLWGAADGLSPAKQILFVSVVFGLFHVVNGFTGQSWGSTLFQMGTVAVASIMDGVIRYGTGSLWPTIALHFLWDSSGVLGEGNIGGLVGPILQALIVVAGVVSLIVIAATRKGGRAVPAAGSAAPAG